MNILKQNAKGHFSWVKLEECGDSKNWTWQFYVMEFFKENWFHCWIIYTRFVLRCVVFSLMWSLTLTMFLRFMLLEDLSFAPGWSIVMPMAVIWKIKWNSFWGIWAYVVKKSNFNINNCLGSPSLGIYKWFA